MTAPTPAPPPDPATAAAMLAIAAAIFLFVGGAMLVRPSWFVNAQLRILGWQQRIMGGADWQIALMRGRFGTILVRFMGFMIALGGVGVLSYFVGRTAAGGGQ